ncbi:MULTISPECIES: DUF1015 domain-containing protein [Caproicibacterium]|jgi:uncharacterized protein (DUF1015 family)|uniref:DUF1015 family protein n=1 Tax=Caproicibacterium lactatifermentans TaxID=2666138 RepID=A0A859DT22_9FIRM|nr:DUF1015 domain-containing protein [Caproicibacterium lactatifermentans]ARP51131.1 hypothetical protein B6259_09730 [Ruminococcaceae bacterium CPB6]MDD4807324.1 DUF1015 domain-containing protein [Oscillospiraceae bacterium]QKN24629.1 DUF1015 family protein [Caproicibacterium lactatifermentans]QKO30128.1 DUF1015 family protein [Caproicibacterium lactatifermentans]
MAVVKPFRALRYTQKAGDIAKLTCPPYDIISEEQHSSFLAESPYNIIRLELPRGENPYAAAGALLKNWEAGGILQEDTQPGLYIYEEEFKASEKTYRIKGVICRVKLEPFERGVILPHEETLSKAKEDRFHLMQTTYCNFSQIYSLYMDPQHTTRARLDALSRDTPRYEFSDGTVTHRLWLVNDPVAISAICADFERRRLYIADGHHRYETALNFRNWCRDQGVISNEPDYCMMMLADMEDPGLVVFPTHRLIHGLPGFNREALLDGCRDQFQIVHIPGVQAISEKLADCYASGQKAFACYCGGDEWDLLVLKDLADMDAALPDKSAASRGLDVSVLHTLILQKVLGIDKENMAKQINLSYTRDMDEAISSVQKGESQCAFLMNPTRVTEIRDVAAAGEKMPQKSTYFYPKLITGLVMNQMDILC